MTVIKSFAGLGRVFCILSVLIGSSWFSFGAINIIIKIFTRCSFKEILSETLLFRTLNGHENNSLKGYININNMSNVIMLIMGVTGIVLITDYFI